jgi:alpha-1,3-mannosyl-glycoprotein beta-1,2-N-acetylglucosaminyltransferase
MNILRNTRRVKGQKRSCSGRFLERGAVVLLLLLAWAWIFVLFGMVFYHGYYRKDTASQSNVKSAQQALRALPGDERKQTATGSENKVSSDRKEAGSGALQPHESPLLIFTCNREEYLEKTLTDIQAFIPSDCSMGCPIIISQDGSNPKVTNVIQDFQSSFSKMGIPLVHLQHKSALRRGSNSYKALAVHYGWALQQVFAGQATDAAASVPPQRVIILEEDIHVAVDFFGYFSAMATVLDEDPSLLAVSAFNDNGFQSHVKDPTRVLRSDFFPGLGWMMSRRLWDNELSLKWPTGYWDDWLREPDQRQGRHVLRPEVSRTFHFGVKGGASGNQFGNRLGKVMLNPTPVDWSAQQDDLSKHLLVDQFNADYWSLIQAAQPADSMPAALDACQNGNVRLEYKSWLEFQRFAGRLELMDDEKAGIPRTGYKGVVETRPHGEHLLFLIPPMNDLQKELTMTTN